MAARELLLPCRVSSLAGSVDVECKQQQQQQQQLAALIAALPKAELHVHVEGTLEPGLLLHLAARNGVALPWADAAAAAAARAHYSSLQDFLDVYYQCSVVLRRQDDFYQLADACFERAAEQGVRHIELFFDPQAHTARGIPFSTFFPGLQRAAAAAPQRHGLTAALFMCFLRDLGPAAAADTLAEAAPFLHAIAGVGLDSAELGHPPLAFAGVFSQAAALGLHRVAHAGEEGGPDYVWSALQDLRVERIDHGIRCLEDPLLVARLEAARTPLTLCPLSNRVLQVYAGCLEARLRQLLCETRIVVTVNSDDPAYFGGGLNDNYAFLALAAGLDGPQLAALAANSFEASLLLSPEEKRRHVADVAAALQAWQRASAGAGVDRL